MRKACFLLILLLLSTTTLLADESHLGILFGGSKRMHADEGKVSDQLSLSNSVVEVFYAVPLDPTTFFRIKAGRISAPTAFRIGDTTADVENGDVEHVDTVVEYRFDEPFGSTGIFFGPGVYRQKGTFTDASGTTRSESETNWGVSAGINGDFPLNRTFGVVLEGSYHWPRFETRSRYLTVTGGLRISF